MQWIMFAHRSFFSVTHRGPQWNLYNSPYVPFTSVKVVLFGECARAAAPGGPPATLGPLKTTVWKHSDNSFPSPRRLSVALRGGNGFEKLLRSLVTRALVSPARHTCRKVTKWTQLLTPEHLSDRPLPHREGEGCVFAHAHRQTLQFASWAPSFISM